ncbi:hypothetical protein C0J52_14234 [Blattella germanica]|nr:hypothetical protein C0J52_14234 [Blattella germanica]
MLVACIQLSHPQKHHQESTMVICKLKAMISIITYKFIFVEIYLANRRLDCKTAYLKILLCIVSRN